MKLSELMPNKDGQGNPILRIYRIPAKIGLCEDKRYGVLIAVSLDGRTFLPTSSSDGYDPKKHILIPKDYPFFDQTGLPKQSYILLDKPQIVSQKNITMIGWLKGPLVEELIRRSRTKVTAHGRSDNPPRHVLVWIRPWAYDRDVPAVTAEQKQMVELFSESRTSNTIPESEARYVSGRIQINRSTPPDFHSWVMVAAEYLYDHAPKSAHRIWRRLIMKHPTLSRNLLLTYVTNMPQKNDDLNDEEIDRMILAQSAAKVFVERCGIPDDMTAFIEKNLSKYFVIETSE